MRREPAHWGQFRPLETGMNQSTPSRIPAVAVAFFDTSAADCDVDDPACEGMRLTFADGAEHRIVAAQLLPLARAFMWHGAKQKFIDAGAISRNPETGRSATVADKKAAILEVIERTTGAEPRWNKVREGGGGSGTLLLEALVRMYAGKKTRDALVDYLAGLGPDQKRALERNARVAPILEAIRTERRLAQGDDGSDELLAGLDD